MKTPIYDICIIGGGAAGMMAGISAAIKSSTLRIVIVEKNDILGRKILATGNGRCNLTNINTSTNDYFGASKDFIANVLETFPASDTIKYFNNISVITKEEDRGRIFPRTNHATTVVNALAEEMQKHHIEVILKYNVKNIDESNGLWNIASENGQQLLAKKVILTTGGRAAHQFGSNGDGLFWLNKKFGIELQEPHAALVPLNLNFKYLDQIMGIKFESKLTLIHENKPLNTARGEVIFTHFGISGPAVMALGRYIVGKGPYALRLDILPEVETEELDNLIQNLALQNGNKNIKNILAGFIPEKLAVVICEVSEVKTSQKAAEISKNDRKNIINNLKGLNIDINSVRPLKESQVTAGGIKESEIDVKTLSLKRQKGLFVAGEIIDVDGKSGGYNLQWAWSSGYLAGKSAAEEI